MLICLCGSSVVRGQLTGTKTIPGDYPTIALAITSLNSSGVGSGGVTFNIAANYTETITATLSLTATGTASNPIVFRKNPATTGADPLITAYTGGVGTPATATQDGIFRLIGSDYVTINGIDIADNPANTTNPSTMEYGYALYLASAANGCHNVMITNCVITLNTINNATGAAPMVDGSTGIIMMNALATAAVTPLTPTTGGANSNNQFYGNTIQKCNTGIALIGFAALAPFTLADSNNDIGGIAPATGNTILNYGGAAGATNAAAAIRTLAQYGLNVSYNTINNNNGGGASHPTTLRGIYINTAASASVMVSYNMITVNGAGTTQAVEGIENGSGSTAAANSVNVSNNTIANCSYSTATTGGFYGIYNTATPATLTINSNSITNNSSAATTTGFFYGVLNTGAASSVTVSSNTITGNSVAALTTGLFAGIYNSASAPVVTIGGNTIAGNSTSSLTGIYYPIYNTGTVTTAININSNSIGTGSLPAATFTAVNSAAQVLINNVGGGAAAALSISNNTFYSTVYAAGGSGSNTYISNAAATLSQAINNNVFSNLNLNTSGSVVCITDNVVMSSTGTQNINGNSIAGTFTKAAGGSITLFTSSASSITGSVVNNNNNNFSNIAVTGATIIAGWVTTDAGAAGRTIQGNTFTNWTGGTGAITAMNMNVTGTGNAITNNSINTIYSAGTIVGITTGAGNDNIYSNSINTLVSTGTIANTVSGITVTAGTTKNIYLNTIFNLQANTITTGSVRGLLIAGATTVNAYQNTIYTLQANALTTGSVNGLWISAGTTVSAYRNKIYDLSSGSNVITTGLVNGVQVSGTTASATYSLFNNLIGDLRTPSASAAETIRGISVTSTGATSGVNVYFNTVYLNATSSGATFGSSGIYHTTSAVATTATLNLRNNIVTNTSVPAGTGLTVAFRRSTSALTNYAASSNNNLFYSGSPAAGALIFYDGTNADQLMSTYKARVAARDALSVTEDLITTSKFLSTSGSSVSFLHLDPTKPTQAESGAVNISGITNDFDGQIRQGNAGYTGTGTAPDIGAGEFNGSVYLLSGTYNVGTGQAFTSLTKAGGLFAAINSVGLSGNLIVNITSDLSEDGTNALYQWSEIGVGNYSLTIQPDASILRTISGPVLTGLIRLNGADRVTIDGSNGGGANYLTFRNTHTAGTTGTAFTFLNGATKNTIRYCNIEAYANATNGVILFSTSAVSGGNSDNVISNCAINATVSANTGNTAIYSAGTVTAGFENADDLVLNNTIFNYRDRGLDITATGSKGWTVKGNSLYNGDVAGLINYAAGSALHGIRILGGAGYSIAGNYIGGNAPLATGTNAVYSSTLGVLSFQGILVTTSAATPVTQIESNTIAKISVSAVPTSTTAVNIFVGIESNGSGVNIGGVAPGDGNIVGSNTANGSIVLTTTTGTATFKSNIRGINCNSTGGLILGNQVGGIDIKNIGAAAAPSTFLGISVNGTTAPSQVNNNIIGSTGAGAAANSIRVLSTSTSTTTGVTGILIGATVTSSIQVNGNIIRNISHQVVTSSGIFTGIGNSATGTAIVNIIADSISANSMSGSTGGFYGIFNAVSPAGLSISNNVISGNASVSATTGYLYGISVSGAPGTVTLNGNIFSGNTTAALTTGIFAGIYNTATPPTLIVNGNSIYGNATTSTSGLFLPIYNGGAVTSTITINSNNIGNSTAPAITFNNATTANSGAQLFIYNNAGTGAAALSISNNNFQGVGYAPVAGTGANTFILNSAATLSQSISGNTFTNLNVKTAGSVTFISDNVVVSGTGAQNVNNNSIVTAFTKNAGGTVTLFTSAATSVSGGVVNNNNNNFSNITVSGATIIAGWVNTDAGGAAKSIQNNTFANWSGGTGALTALAVSISATGNVTTGNLINNLSGAGPITGIATGAGNDNIFSNTINTLSSTGAFAVTGLAVTAGTTKNIYKNKLYDLSNSNATGTVNGMAVSGGITVNVYNNLIGDLRTAAANSVTDAIRGIGITSATVTSGINIYYNTIYLNATSTGTNFGSSGIYHTTSATATTAVLNLRNNSITNTSTPKGSGLTVAYRRSTTALTNYAATSNNNLFYGGIPGAGRLIFSDGTNSDQTIGAYKTRVSARDALSVSEDLTAKFLSTAGTSPVFLHMSSVISSLIESGAVNIPGYTDDFDGQIRAGNPGYTGTSSSPDIGADEIFGLETTPPAISYTLLGNVTSISNRSVTGITITDASGVNTAAGTKPRIYYKRSSDANVWLDNTASTNGWKYAEASNSSSPFTFTIDYSLLYEGTAVTAGVIQYFIVAQDIATTANIGINSGTFAAPPSSVGLTAAAFPIGGAINSYTIPFSGTYNVGAGQIFTSLTRSDGLFAAVNSAGLMGNTLVNITSDLAEDGTNALNQWTESGVGNYTLTIAPDAATLRTVSGNAAGGLIRLNGADRVTIDGSSSGAGVYLSFINTNTGGATGTAFTFLNGASNNTIRYCDVEGSANATNGVILFGTSTAAGGNSNNNINNSTIVATVGANTGITAFYSGGTVGKENAGDTIANNAISNYRDRGLDISATGSTGWTISGNSFFNGAISGSVNYPAASALHGIRILGGSGYAILNNSIGGDEALTLGPDAVYASTLGNVSFQGILLATSSATPASNIKGNVISAIAVSSVPTAANSIVFSGIEVSGAGINIGGTADGDGNTIGLNQQDAHVTITTTTGNASFTSVIRGISCASTGGLIIGNEVSALNIDNTGAAPASSLFQGIYINSAAPPSQVNDNTIGSDEESLGIHVLAASTATTTALMGIDIGPAVNAPMQVNGNNISNFGQLSTVSSGSFTGIVNEAISSLAVMTISGDTVQFIRTAANASVNSTLYTGISSSSPSTISNNVIDDIRLNATGSAAQIRGIGVSGAFAYTIGGNILSDFWTASVKAADLETGAPSQYTITGILQSATAAGQVISGNTLFDFHSTTPAATGTAVTAIAVTAGSGSLFDNRISSFGNTATGSSSLPGIGGVAAFGGTFYVYNNSIKIDNELAANGVKIYGLLHATGTNWNYYFNSVSISGNSTGAAARSAAFVRSASGTVLLRNNVLANARTGTGSNYAISNLASPPATNWSTTASDYNDLYSSNTATIGEWGVAANETFPQWQMASGGEAHSVSRQVSFLVSDYDLEPDSLSNCALDHSGTPITTPILINKDIKDSTRSVPFPDMGAYEFGFTPFTIHASNNSPVCAGSAVTLSVDPGHAFGPSFSWKNPAGSIVASSQNPNVAAMAGQFVVSVTDGGGCTVSDSTLVLLAQRPTASLTGATTLCAGDSAVLRIAVTGTGMISGSLSSGDVFSGIAPLILVTVGPATTTSYSIVSLSDSSCSSTPADLHDTVTLSVTHAGGWLATVDSNWNNPANWCGGLVPVYATNVVIPAGGVQPVIGVGGGICNNLTIDSGASLTIIGTNSLTVGGNLENDGTFIAGSGTVFFDGPAGLQTLNTGGSAFHNISNTGNATLQLVSHDLIATGYFTNEAGAGDFDAATNGLAQTITGLVTLKGGNYLAGADSLICNGGLTLSGGSLTGGSGSITTTDLTLGSGNLIAPSGIFTVTGSWINNGGTFTPGPNTVIFTGATTQTIGGSNETIFTNFTAANPAGITSGNITINGVLDLHGYNPSDFVGDLNLGLNTLNMGATATTIGVGDVTGIVRRTTLLPNISYTFGNTFTSATFQDVGAPPGELSFKISIGTAPSWKPDAISRIYDIAFKRGANFRGTVRFHYTDAELNDSIVEDELVIYRYLVSSSLVIESGRSNFNDVDEWVELASLSSTGGADSNNFGVLLWTLGNQSAVSREWNGSTNTDWTNPLNWTGGVPGPLDAAVIPDAHTTAFSPTLPDSTTINSLTIDSSGILNGGAGRLFLAGGNGTWIDRGLFNFGSSTVTFTNAAATIAGASDFFNITIDTGAALTMSDGQYMRIYGAMTNRGTWNAAFVKNTVEYSNDDQIVVYPNGGIGGYYNLILDEGGNKVMPDTTMNILGNFEIQDSASATARAPLIIGGKLIMEPQTTFNAGGYDHSIKGDWDNSGTFIPGSNSITFNGDSIQNIKGGSVTTFNKLTVSGAGILLAQDVVINSTLTLGSGNFNLGLKTLTMGPASGPIGGGPFSVTHMIIADGGGEVRKAATSAAQAGFVFPIGDNTPLPGYTPVTLTFSGGSYAGYAGVKVADLKHPRNANITDYLSRYWTISQSGYTGFSATVAVTYLDSGGQTDVVGDEASILMGEWVGTTPWLLFPSSIDTARNTLTATGVTSFGDFSGIDSSHPRIDSIAASPSATVCQNTALTLTVRASGDSVLTYAWSNGLGSNASAVPSTSSAGTTVYGVTVTDGNGLTAVASVSVRVNPLSALVPAAAAPDLCFNTGAQTDSLTYTDSSHAATSYSITWNSPAIFAGFVSVSHALLPAGSIVLSVPAGAPPATYTGTITGRNASGCEGAGIAFTITIKPTPDFTLFASAQGVCINASSQITTIGYAASSDTLDTYSLVWGAAAMAAGFQPVTAALLPDSLIPISIPANAPAATYSGSIITSNAFGCRSAATVFTVSVNPHPNTGQVSISTKIACSGDSPTISVVSASLGDGAFTVQYDLSGANSSTGNTATLSMLSGNGTFTVAAPSNTGSTLLTITSISNSSNCSSSTTGDTVTIVVRRAGTWLGPVSADWFTDGNWCGGVPNGATNVLIRGGSPFYPAVNGGTAAAANITILNGASLKVNGGIVQIAGTIANSGIFDASNGSIDMNGSSAQIIPAAIFAGNTIRNLTLQNEAGVSLNGILNLSGILKVSSGSFNAGGYLTLLSTAAGTALIDGSGAGEVLGNVTMQRYLASGFGYKYFSSPFQADSVNDFSQEINLAAPFPDVYSFDESLSSAGWINYTNPSGIFTPMAGYAVNFGSSSAPLTVSLTGVVNNHTVSSPDLYNHNMPFTQGFNLVGNPYPSPINWDVTAGWTKTNIDNALYFFNAGTTDQYTGTYSSYVSGVSSDGIAGNVISAMQGFFIHVSNGTFPVTGQLAVNNNARNLNPNTVFLGFTAPRGPSPLVRLTAGFADEVTISDPAVFYFQEGGTRTFNNKLDALKLMNTHIGVPNLYAVAADSAKLSIFALPDFPDSLLVIPLGLKTAKDGWITFRAADLSNIPAGLYVYFFDAKTGTDQNLEKTPAYRLFLSSGSYENRFFLKFRTQELITDNGPGSGTFSAYGAAGSIFVDGHLGAGEKGSIAVIDLLGQVMYRQEISGDGYQALHSNFMTGVYLVYFSTAKVSQVKKIFISNR